MRSALGSHAGDWAIPGGFVEHGETIDAAIQRKLREEAAVAAEPHGVIAVRNRVMDGENSAYIVFLLRATSDATRPDGFEVDDVRYCALEEALALPRPGMLSRIILTHVLERLTSLLTPRSHPDYPPSEYVLYL